MDIFFWSVIAYVVLYCISDFINKFVLYCHHKTWTFLGGIISMHFMVFSYGQGTKWHYYFGLAKISNIFLGVRLI